MHFHCFKEISKNCKLLEVSVHHGWAQGFSKMRLIFSKISLFLTPKYFKHDVFKLTGLIPENAIFPVELNVKNSFWPYCLLRTQGCRVCPLIVRKGKMKSKTQKDKFTTKYSVNCRSSNLRYCTKCKICKKEYVGQTKQTLKERINEHITSVKRSYNK